MEEDEEYWEKWKSHSRCLKNLKPSCEECLDVERCKRDYKFNMLEYQLIRKREGQISVEFDAWFEQELKIYLIVIKSYRKIPNGQKETKIISCFIFGSIL